MTFEEWFDTPEQDRNRLYNYRRCYAKLAWEEAIKAERERCAKLVETAGAYTDWNEEAVDVAAQIRAGEG
jgi:hypothetical protein